MFKRFIYSIFVFFICFSTSVFASDFKISDVKTDYSEEVILLNGNINANYVNYSAGVLENPLRAYIDLENTVLVANKKTIEFKNSLLKKIVMAQFQTNPNKVRMVFYSDNADVLKNIKLIKHGNSLTFKLNSFEYKESRIPIIFSDILPKEYEEFGENANFEPFITKDMIALDACTYHTRKVNVVILED